MHRNTYLLLIFLAIFAAIVVGVNLTRGPKQPIPATGQVPPQATPLPAVSQPKPYKLTGCGISFPAPINHTALEGPGNTVVFTATSDNPIKQDPTSRNTIIVTCQKSIPRPALPEDKVEKLAFELPGKKPTTISATLYHDTGAKDGVAMDKLIFQHPNGLDIFVTGYGDAFQTLIRQLSILR